MTEAQTNRFKGAPWFTNDVYCFVGGAGGIGSWLTLLLARANFFPVVYDFDTLEEHNMGGQLYSREYIGKPKVLALKEIVKKFADTDINVSNEKFKANSMGHVYMFSAFDNMQARKDMFQVWCNLAKDAPNAIFIDGRLTGEQLQIFCVTPNEIEEYKKHLFHDSEVPDAPCTLKQTSHSAAMIAAHMVGFFTNHITNVISGGAERDLPFYYEYFIPLNLHFNDTFRST